METVGPEIKGHGNYMRAGMLAPNGFLSVNDCYRVLGLVPTATVPDMSVTSMYILTFRHMDPLVYTFIALAPGRHCSCASVLVQASVSCVKAFPVHMAPKLSKSQRRDDMERPLPHYPRAHAFQHHRELYGVQAPHVV